MCVCVIWLHIKICAKLMGGVFIFLVFLCVCFKFIGVVEESAGVASVA